MEARTIPVTLFIHYATSTFSHEKLLVATVDMSKNFPDRYILLESREIEITVNQPEPIDIIGLQVGNCVNKNRKQSPTPNSVLLLSMTKSSSYFASNTRQIPMSSPTKNH